MTDHAWRKSGNRAQKCPDGTSYLPHAFHQPSTKCYQNYTVTPNPTPHPLLPRYSILQPLICLLPLLPCGSVAPATLWFGYPCYHVVRLPLLPQQPTVVTGPLAALGPRCTPPWGNLENGLPRTSAFMASQKLNESPTFGEHFASTAEAKCTLTNFPAHLSPCYPYTYTQPICA